MDDRENADSGRPSAHPEWPAAITDTLAVYDITCDLAAWRKRPGCYIVPSSPGLTRVTCQPGPVFTGFANNPLFAVGKSEAKCSQNPRQTLNSEIGSEEEKSYRQKVCFRRQNTQNKAQDFIKLRTVKLKRFKQLGDIQKKKPTNLSGSIKCVWFLFIRPAHNKMISGFLGIGGSLKPCRSQGEFTRHCAKDTRTARMKKKKKQESEQ
ncbi:hypothetical protein PoB_006380700 [Plakobranchus ocellatus]|uniref:Uncharacterized protein n=1 Tax=Plakobranchus ocellatus TaxID=259542 RepID=A0AAV4CZH5_9GAST|nr:hypothetical protein PoB_006380700 [Plakobranchus ocellatus]